MKNENDFLKSATTAKQLLRRLTRGAERMWRVPLYIALLILLLTAPAVLWISRYTVIGYDADWLIISKLMDVAVGLLCVVIAIAIMAVYLFLLGGPLQASAVQDNLARIGFCNKAGEVPCLIAVRKVAGKKGIEEWVFETIGIDRHVWLERAPEIQASINKTIVTINYEDSYQQIILTVARPYVQIPKRIEWRQGYLPSGPLAVSLGQSIIGPVIMDLTRIPHALIAGSTGSGKSVLLNAVLWQLLNKHASIHIIDMKGGVDYQPFAEYADIALHTTLSDTLAMLRALCAERSKRDKLLFDSRTRNIDEYNNAHVESVALRHIVIAVDEASMLLDAHGADKATKEVVAQITAYVAEIARMGRSAGIHLILATQRPDADAIPGAIKSLIDYRICGRADATLSAIVLGDGKAHEMIPKNDPGLFVINDPSAIAGGLLFRGYWCDVNKGGDSYTD